MTISNVAPIACTLGSSELGDRLAWISELNRDALQRHERQGSDLVLTYGPGATDRVREMVRREQACCSFLTFDLREGPDEIQVTIGAPEEACDAADLLFEQF